MFRKNCVIENGNPKQNHNIFMKNFGVKKGKNKKNKNVFG